MAADRIRPDVPYFSRFVVQGLGLTILGSQNKGPLPLMPWPTGLHGNRMDKQIGRLSFFDGW